QFIKHDTLPTNDLIYYHCFVSKTNQQNYQMLLFCKKTGLSIEYDEHNNIFQFHQLPVYDDIASFYKYAYVCINDVILFFGGYSIFTRSKSAHKYSIRENKWIAFQNILPSRLYDCVAVLSEDNTYVYIIGGYNKGSVSTHTKTEVSKWMSEEEMKKGIELKVEEKEKKNEMETIVKKETNKKQNKVKKDSDVERCFITGK
ncbi:hypothetical protein RFI_39090, partial [Reticulomyxa filosa]